MKSISKLCSGIFTAALVVIGGMSAAAHATPPPGQNTESGSGAVALSVTLDTWNSVDIILKRTDAKGKTRITVSANQKDYKIETDPLPPEASKEGIFPRKGSQYRTYSVYKTLPPGKYIIQSMWISDSIYRVDNAGIDKIPFEVTSGRTTYIGGYGWQLLFGVSRIGLTAPQGWSFAISDREKRDTSWIKADHPESGEFVVSVPETWNRTPWL